MFKKAFVYLGVLAAGVSIAALFATWLTAFPSNGKHLSIKLSRGPLTVFNFPSKGPGTSACILFASGDGGWNDFEETIAHTFQDHGYAVIGIDSEAYAQADYDLDTLQSDFGKIAATVLAPFGNHSPPLIVGGYSMGAAQAIAVAGGPHPPPGLIGLLLIDPLSRGRYGLRSSDQMNVLPTGSGTFGVDSFCHSMDSLRVVQWHAANDSVDSLAWLDSLTAQHRNFTFPDAGHDYEPNRNDFVRQLVESTAWILNPAQTGMKTAKARTEP
jgi:phosphatidylglycerol lysyltransferase